MRKIIFLFMFSVVFAVSLVVSALESEATVLIATEESEFKQAVVKKVTESLEEKNIAVRVIDLEQLAQESTDNYEAVVIINTIWGGYLRENVSIFLKKLSDKEKQKIILISTANREDWRTKETGIHAITSASKMNKVDSVSGYVIEKIDDIIKKE